MDNEVKKQIINHLKVLDHEDPFHDRHYDMEIKDDKYSTEYVQSALDELVKEKIIDPLERQKIGDNYVWMIHRKTLTYYEVENSGPKVSKIAVATTKDINANSVHDRIFNEIEKFGLKEKDFDLGFPQFYRTISKDKFDHYDIKIKA